MNFPCEEIFGFQGSIPQYEDVGTFYLCIESRDNKYAVCAA